MAEVQQKEKGKEKKGKQKKMTIRVDFTPMVDMNMLLITFFMLCTSLSKPQTMELAVPSKDKVEAGDENKAAESRAITFLLAGGGKVYYYMGKPDYEDPATLKETTYDAGGIRALLLERNKKVVAKIEELKQQKREHKLSVQEYEQKVREAKADKEGRVAPIVMIKATDDSSYKNLVDALDEMQICSIGIYALVEMSEGDQWLLQNLKKSRNI